MTSSTFQYSSNAQQWLSLVCVIWLQSISGTNTNFPAYSSQLKNTLSISQFELNNLTFASDAGKLFGWVAGVAALYLPLWLVLSVGSMLGLAGYGFQYLFVSNQISSFSYWQIFLLTVVSGNSICWINTVCYVVTIQNFASFSQVAVGLSTSYQGLSAKIYIELVDAIKMSTSPFQREKAYLMLNAVVPLAVTLVTANLVGRRVSSSIEKIGAGLLVIFFISISTGVYAVISSLSSISGRIKPKLKTLCMGIFLLAPLGVPVTEKIKEMMANRKQIIKTNEIKAHDFDLEMTEGEYSSEMCLEKGEAAKDAEEQGHCANEENKIQVMEEIGVFQMVRRVNFWLYVFLYLCGATLGLVYANNLGQIAESRRLSNVSDLVSLSSSFTFFGRLVPPIIDYLLPRYKCTVSRPMVIAVFMAPIPLSFFLLALNSTAEVLYISTSIIGLCSGAIISMSVSTTFELFGTRNFSVNHNVVIANIPIGSFIFGYLAAYVYRKEGQGMQNGKCMGINCYRNTFLIWGSLSFAGTILAIILTYRTRNFYNQKNHETEQNFEVNISP